MFSVYLGAPALTTRGFKEEDFKTVVRFMDDSIKIAVKAQEKSGLKNKVVFYASRLSATFL